jgi:branched-chain amino acid transport system substrate-binding protein
MASTPMLASKEGKEGPGVKPGISWFPANAIAAATATVLAAAVLAGCSSSSSTSGSGTSQGSSSGPITIGASLSLDGPRSADGLAFQQGYLLWEHDVNAHGGLLGRQVKLVILNDHSSANTVVTNYQKLIGQDHVDLTFGPYSSLLTTPASAVAARYGYAFVEGAGGAPAVFDTPLNQADHNVFDVSQPVADQMLPLVNYIKSLPVSQQKTLTVAFPYTEDPFAAPPVQLAATLLLNVLSQGNEKTYAPFIEPATGPEAPATLTAQAVVADHPDVVILGSTDVPMVAAFVAAFKKAKYNPKIFVAASGPDQGAAFTTDPGGVGTANAAGIMVPNGWYGSFQNSNAAQMTSEGITTSQQMVGEYIKKNGGTAAGVNADVAEAYSVGQVMAQAVTATGGTDNAKIIQYLHSGATMQSVQGPVLFDALGENSKAVGFLFQWSQTGKSFGEGLLTDGSTAPGFVSIKPNWGTG